MNTDEPSAAFRELAERERHFNATGNRSEQKAVLAEMRAAAEAADDDSLRADVAARRAEWALRAADFRTGLEAATRGAALGDLVNRPDIAGRALRSGGMCLYHMGRLEDGLEWQRQATRRAEMADDVFGLLQAHSNIAVISLDLGLPEVARAFLDQAVEDGERLLDRRLLAGPLNNLAMVCHRLGDYGRAVELQLEAVGLAEEQANVDLLAHVLSSLGILHEALGRSEQAVGAFTRAIELGAQSGDAKIEAYATGCRGRSLFWMSELDGASADLERALSLVETLGTPHRLIELSLDLAAVRVATGDPDGAGQLLGDSAGVAPDLEAASLALKSHVSAILADVTQVESRLEALERLDESTATIEPEVWWRASAAALLVGRSERAERLRTNGDNEADRRAGLIGNPDLSAEYRTAALRRRGRLIG